MTSDRLYRGRCSDAEAVAEIIRCAGTQFDPSVVDALSEELEPAEIEPMRELQHAAAV